MPVGQPNLFGLKEYDNRTDFFGDGAPLSQAVGYPLVIGVAFAFVLFTVGLFWLDRRYAGTEYDSEHFQNAGRKVKTGLISVDVVSHWCWSSTILQSANQTWIYGVTGAYAYAGAAIIQILCFGIIAVYIKKHAPSAHTVLEIVHARWGTAARLVFFYFLIVTSIVVAGQLILGGAAVIHALTGMNTIAAIFIIPATVAMYTAVGGLKSTFVSSYVHTVIIYVILLIFCFAVYTVSDKIGSISTMYDRLVKMARVEPVDGNRGGSFLTFFSVSGLKFGVLQIISCWGITIVDQAYWQSAVAARPSAAWKGYIIGGLLWFAIPFGYSTSLGLTARALDLPLTVAEAGDGLVPPAASVAILGKAGAIMIVIIILMAITSSGSAEMVAVSSLLTYDIYKPYFKPKADGKHLLLVSRIMVALYALVMALVSVIFYKVNINLNFLYFLMATATTSAVPPLASAVMWKKCSKAAALSGSIIGQIAGITAWLVETHIEYKTLNTTTLQQIGPALTGGCFSLFISLFITVLVSSIWPQNFDWAELRKGIPNFNAGSAQTIADNKEIEDEMAPEELARIEKKIWIWAGSLSFVFILGWPLLTLPAVVFSKGYFTWWVVLSFIWSIVAFVLATLLPIAEAWRVFALVLSRCFPFLRKYAVEPPSISPQGSEKEVPLGAVPPPPTGVAPSSLAPTKE